MNGLLAPFLGYKVGIGKVNISFVGGLTGQLEPEAGLVLLLLWPELDMYDICILYSIILIQISARRKCMRGRLQGSAGAGNRPPSPFESSQWAVAGAWHQLIYNVISYDTYINHVMRIFLMRKGMRGWSAGAGLLLLNPPLAVAGAWLSN